MKLRWLKDNVPEVANAMESGDCLFGTVDTWLLWNLTGGVNGGAHVTDVSNASRTMLMNIETCKWEPELLQFFEIPETILPQIRSSSEIYGLFANGSIKVSISMLFSFHKTKKIKLLCRVVRYLDVWEINKQL